VFCFATFERIILTLVARSTGTYVYTFGAGYHGQLGRKFVRGQKKYCMVSFTMRCCVFVYLNCAVASICIDAETE